ncbi:MAG TPA: YiiX/YebB-like N1pC/P60 family cysteine hydrolase [Saprospiraceae bacterium]|nr:YiiX/YebB-like N1pC/P60 family cysteine hydrolase [Saprospiraceae bacterium]
MKRRILTFLFTFYFLASHAQFAFELKTGDLLFQDLDCGPLCEAIESVTEGIDGRDFSHCGIVMVEDGQKFVIEAIGPGVIKTDLKQFLRRSGDSLVVKNVVAARLNSDFQNLIIPAITEAKLLLGKAYDHVFDLKNDAYYCSELLYDIFRKANNGREVFDLAPMTFKKPNTDDYDAAWVNYYQDLGAEIPEKALGTNPGLISRSDKIFILK